MFCQSEISTDVTPSHLHVIRIKCCYGANCPDLEDGSAESLILANLHDCHMFWSRVVVMMSRHTSYHLPEYKLLE